MSYYPILKAPGCEGWTTLSNYPPNNWESLSTSKKEIYVTWAHEGMWRSESIGMLDQGDMITVRRSDVSDLVPDNELPFLSLTSDAFPSVSEVLPSAKVEETNYPRWRATLGLSSLDGETSYQGEIDPFPVPGSLLSFSPFLQYGEEVENYLLFLNLESGAQRRSASVEIYDALEMKQKAVHPVYNNDCTVVPLDGLELKPADLPVVICKGMSGIPLLFSRTQDGSYMSMEHTHPPASMYIHGNRWGLQKIIKGKWFSRTETSK